MHLDVTADTFLIKRMVVVMEWLKWLSFGLLGVSVVVGLVSAVLQANAEFKASQKYMNEVFGDASLQPPKNDGDQ